MRVWKTWFLKRKLPPYINVIFAAISVGRYNFFLTLSLRACNSTAAESAVFSFLVATLMSARRIANR
jgi:hypothetical protein